jgi:indolepyruvate ferredoxin oxidoreductase, beta subunit
MMTSKNILLIGVGGQGTILFSKIMAAGLVELGFDVKMSEIHGMSQRGGSVSTQVKYGEKVYSPNIGKGEADLIVAFEKVEALRALPFLKEGGSIITDEREIYSVPVMTGTATYPHEAYEEIKKTVPSVKLIKAAETAKELGSLRAQNIVLLGAMVRMLGLDKNIDWKRIVGEHVPPKTREMNLAAFDAGYAMLEE